MSNATSEPESPTITKVGAAVLRKHEGMLQVLVIQPKPKAKTPNDLPPIGLVRGTRMYRDASGVLVDANHDGRTAPDGVLEPVRETLHREIEEEAGVTKAMLMASNIIDMGPRVFASTKKIPYPIHWFVVVIPQTVQLPHTGFQDSLHSEWVTLEQFKNYVGAKKASCGYIAVIEEAIRLAAPD